MTGTAEEPAQETPQPRGRAYRTNSTSPTPLYDETVREHGRDPLTGKRPRRVVRRKR